MSVVFRNVDVPGDRVEDWPYEAVVTAIERGTIGDWARIGRAVAAAPWGEVARQVEEYLVYSDEPGVASLLRRRLARARSDREQAERQAVATLVREYVARSGLSRERFARRVGTSRSRLSTYCSGRVTPSAAMMLRMSRAASAGRAAPPAAGRAGTMTTIGLLGGMSWHSSADYYRLVNEEVAARLGGHHSAEVLMRSVDFEEIRAMQRADDWAAAGARLAEAALQLQAGGAAFVVLCTNLMHKAAPDIEAALDIPLLHIADAVGSRVAAAGYGRVGLLGTRWVMEEPFYRDRLARGFGVDVVVPDAAGRELVDRVIFDELTFGRVEDSSRADFVEVIEGLATAGAEAVVLACTEIGLLVGAEDSPLPVVDSTRVHALAAVAAALVDGEAPAGAGAHDFGHLGGGEA